MADFPHTTRADDVLIDAERRLRGVADATGDVTRVLHRLAAETDWQSPAASGFHIAIDDLKQDAARAQVEASELAGLVSAARWRLMVGVQR